MFYRFEFLLSVIIPRFRSFTESLFARRSSSIPALSTRKKIPFFDPSIRINPDLIKTHACELLIGYQFREPLLLWEALQAIGSASGLPQMPRYEEGNMRLAIVGDRVLDLLLALKWYPTWDRRRKH